MTSTLQPDWIIAGAEPTTDRQLLRGIPDLNRFDQARAADKAILVTQTSPYKERAQDVAAAQLTAYDIYLRDVWDGFQPQDQAFETMWHQLVQKKGVLAVAYWWGNRTFWGGYLPYDPSLSYDQATGQVDHTAYVNMLDPSYVLNTEGQLWAAFATAAPLPSPTADPGLAHADVGRPDRPTRRDAV